MSNAPSDPTVAYAQRLLQDWYSFGGSRDPVRSDTKLPDAPTVSVPDTFRAPDASGVQSSDGAQQSTGSDHGGIGILMDKSDTRVVSKFLEQERELELEFEPTRLIDKFGPCLRDSLSNRQRLLKLKTEKKDLEIDERGKYWLWVTVSPRLGTTLAQLSPLVAKALTKVWVNDFYLAYEQSGDTIETMGHHPHIHMLIHRVNETPTHCSTGIISTFTPVADPKCIKIVHLNDGLLKQKLNYMQGKKTDEKKKEIAEIDVLWRQQEGIKPMYRPADLGI